MFHRFIIKFLLLMFIVVRHTSAANNGVSLDLQHANLADAIRSVAAFLNMNVIISPSVTGMVTLHLHDASPVNTMDMLLTTHGLARWKMGNVWLIAPRTELILRKEEESKWRNLWDETAPLVTQVWEIRYGKAEDIARLLQDEHAALLSKRGRVRMDARTNIIYVQDLAERIEDVRRLIKRVDVPVKQILIEARLASVDNDFERELGIKYTVQSAVSEDKEGNFAGKFGREATRYSIAVAKLADGSLLDVKLAALENAGHAELISNPSLFTANQQAASIEAGEEVPYQQVSESGGTAVVFKKAVLGLKVIPQVLPGNRVMLQLQINQDRPSNRMVLGVPMISTRRIVTNVLVRAGQTIVLGGIYESNNERGQLRIPFISQVPLLGMLFKQTNTRETRRELLIFVTPNIISQDVFK